MVGNVGRGITSPPWDSTHGWQRWAWHDITALGLQTQSNDVRRGMQSSPLGSTHGRTTSRMACHHRPWTANTVERCRAWHAIIAFGLADTVGQRRAWHAIIALGRQTRSNDVGRGMQSSPLDSTDSRTASGVACYHLPWVAQTVGRRRASHAIIALGQHTRSAVVGRARPS